MRFGASIAALGVTALGCSSTPAITQIQEIAVTPQTASVLTCSTETFTAKVTGAGSPTVTWSAEEGTIDASGVYTAPRQVPAGASDEVTAQAEADVTAQAEITLSTAHPTKPAAIGSQTTPKTTLGVFNHVVASHGDRVYAVTSSEDSKTQDWSIFVYASVDGGVTWKAPVDLNDAKDRAIPVDDAVVTVDPVNPKLVYVLYHYETGGVAFTKSSDIDDAGKGDTDVLAVSTDGGATFTRSVLASADAGHWGTPGDVVAPAENAVVVIVPSSDPISVTDARPRFVGVWSDKKEGAGFAATGTGALQGYVADGLATPFTGEGDPASPKTPFTRFGDDGGTADLTEGARLFTDGQGKTCVVFVADSQHGATAHPVTQQRVYVQCSSDDGVTFTKPVIVDPEDVNESTVIPHLPQGTFGPDGAMAIAWYAGVSRAGNVAYLSLSKDGGKVWSKPTTPSAYVPPGDPLGAVTTDLDVRYEGSVLWIAYHAGNYLGTDRIAVDKSCDGGKTWSGPQLASGVEGGTLFGLEYPGLVVTKAGLRMSAFGAEKTLGLQTFALEP
jgi:hypothetical protein